MDISIREANYCDLCEINKLLKKLANFHSKKIPKIFKLNPDIKLELGENNHIFIGEINDDIVGFIELTIKETPDNEVLNGRKYLWIENLIVNEKFRNKGVGKDLVNKALDFAKYNKIEEVELFVWNFDESSYEFYKNLGFTDMMYRLNMSMKNK